MKKDILDLRFIIGLFFSIVGLALVIASFLMQTTVEKSEETNFWSGIFYVVFGVLMIALWFYGKSENEYEETVES